MIRYILFFTATFICFCATAQNVGIGTLTPAAKLDVIGTIKITDGTQGSNKILTSDNNGLATWATPPLTGSFQFSSSSNVNANDYIGLGTNGVSFVRNTIVVPFNCELLSITYSGRGAIAANTAIVFAASGLTPTVPVNTGLSTSVSAVTPFSSILGSYFLTKGDLISVRISSSAIDGATVTLTYRTL